jgi:hypothetical protein
MTAFGTLSVFCVYLFALGISGMLVPNQLLALIGMPPTDEVWGRVAAMLVFNLAILYVWIIRTRSTQMIGYTVVTRIIVFVVLTAFALAGLAPANIILFGALDAVGGLWTLWALRRDVLAGRVPATPKPS